MRMGAFEIREPLPELRDAHAIVTLRPWVDVGSVGSLVIARLEAHFEAKELGKLARPGNFFDFTRYRPTIYSIEGSREIIVPNSFVTCTRREAGNDFLFFHLLEPHMFGEEYIESILLLLKRFGVKRYVTLGSMYDFVPHTRPLLVTGGGFGKGITETLRKLGVASSDYQGPTSITSLVGREAAELGIETFTLIVHLPQYTQVEEDYIGLVRLMEVLDSFYGIPTSRLDVEKAERQHEQLVELLEKNQQLKEVVGQLEIQYDARLAKSAEEEGNVPRLSPEVEKFLREIDRRFREE